MFIIDTPNIEEIKKFGFETELISESSIEVYVKGEETDSFIKKLGSIVVNAIDIRVQSLEEIFMGYYGKEDK